MSIPIAKIEREKGYIYFLDSDGDISRCPMAKGGQTFKHLKEKVSKLGIKKEKECLYYLDREGNLLKSPMFQKKKEFTDKDPYEKGVAFEKYIINLLPEQDWSIVDYTKDTIKDIPRKIESSSNPDIILRHRGTNKLVALECKYRADFFRTETGRIMLVKDYQINNYKAFNKEKGYPVFIVVGVGNKPSNPGRLFLFPLNSIQYSPTAMEYIEKFGIEPENLSLMLTFVND